MTRKILAPAACALHSRRATAEESPMPVAFTVTLHVKPV